MGDQSPRLQDPKLTHRLMDLTERHMDGVGPIRALGLDGDFIEVFARSHFSQQEQRAQTSWIGPHLSPVLSSRVLGMVSDRNQGFEDLVHHIWRGASPQPRSPQPGSPQPRSPQIGTHHSSPFLPPQPTGSPQLVAPASMPPQPSNPPLPSSGRPLPAHPGKAPMGADTAPEGQHLTGYAKDWKELLSLKRVSAYSFRGDTRGPEEIKKAQGFRPSSERTDPDFVSGPLYNNFCDYLSRTGRPVITKKEFEDAFNNSGAKPDAFGYHEWKMLMDLEIYHLGRMLANETLKGYVSTTKAVTVAKGFSIAKEKITEGWVYCLRVEGGIDVPAKGTHPWTHLFGEQEIAYPGSIAWEDVVACRKVDKATGKFVGSILMRKSFDELEPETAEEILELLGGKDQTKPETPEEKEKRRREKAEK